MIDDCLQVKLKNRFNPEGSELRKIQLRMLEMLKYVDNLCKKNNIPYWLSAGTCLGAVRHGGFIPWDDDLDIEMLGDDYERFKKIIEGSNSKYVLQTRENDNHYNYTYAKLRDNESEITEIHGNDEAYKYKGIFIDIFPMDSNNSKIMSFWFGRIGLYIYRKVQQHNNNIIRYKIYSFIKYLISNICPYLLKIKSHGRLRNRFPSLFRETVFIKDIFPLKYIPFEDGIFPVANNTDVYLKAFFSDYKQLPNINNLHPHITKVKWLKED